MNLQKIKDEPNKGRWGVVDKLYSTAPTLILGEVSGLGIAATIPMITHAGNARYYGKQAYKVSFSLRWEDYIYVDRHFYLHDGLPPEHSEKQILSEFRHINRARDKRVTICVLPFITICALTKFCLKRQLDITTVDSDKLPVLMAYRKDLN